MYLLEVAVAMVLPQHHMAVRQGTMVVLQVVMPVAGPTAAAAAAVLLIYVLVVLHFLTG